MMSIAGVTNIPASRLFGSQASGLNNKGEQDRDNYNGYITQEQGKSFEPTLGTLLTTLFGGEEIDFIFNPVDTFTQSELIGMKKAQAGADKIYMEMQVISPDEVRASRFTGVYSFETELTDGEMSEPEEDGEDEELPDLEDMPVEETVVTEPVE